MLEMADRPLNPGTATKAMLSDSSFMGSRLLRGAARHINFRRPNKLSPSISFVS